jgi:hypothetical protein
LRASITWSVAADSWGWLAPAAFLAGQPLPQRIRRSAGVALAQGLGDFLESLAAGQAVGKGAHLLATGGCLQRTLPSDLSRRLDGAALFFGAATGIPDRGHQLLEPGARGLVCRLHRLFQGCLGGHRSAAARRRRLRDRYRPGIVVDAMWTHARTQGHDDGKQGCAAERDPASSGHGQRNQIARDQTGRAAGGVLHHGRYVGIRRRLARKPERRFEFILQAGAFVGDARRLFRTDALAPAAKQPQGGEQQQDCRPRPGPVRNGRAGEDGGQGGSHQHARHGHGEGKGQGLDALARPQPVRNGAQRLQDGAGCVCHPIDGSTAPPCGPRPRDPHPTVAGSGACGNICAS